MSLLAVALLLASALIHAGWNTLLKGGEDRFWLFSVITLAGAVAALPFLLILEPPDPRSWPYLISSSLLQIGYCLFLVQAYRHGDLAHVYPVVRGSAPLLVTLGAAIFASELPQGLGLVGILAVSVGIAILATGKNRADAASLLSALGAGTFIASYMVVDGLGVRISGSATGYAAWQAAVAGCMIPFSFVVIRRKPISLPRGKSGGVIVLAGIFSTLGYAIAVWAMSLNTMGGVSAIRETSILFAGLLGVLVLGEKATLQKIVGALVITGGVVALSLG